MKNQKNTRLLFATLAAAAGAALSAAVPEVSGVTMTQASDRLVTITYALAAAPAVMTLDVQTNVTGDTWASIGGEAVWNAMGDVWRKVETGTHTITWHPDHSWPDHKVADGGARAVVTAWALDNTPDYMVVDLNVPNARRFYPGVDFLPKDGHSQDGAAITNNAHYKTDMLVMRKIPAAGIEWTRSDGSKMYKVTLPDNYYIGVFEITQRQWKLVTGTKGRPHFTIEGDMRPMDNVAYNEIRCCAAGADTVTEAGGLWPNDPYDGSFLGLLRARTGLAFDLPSESQWDFACFPANGDNSRWYDGSSCSPNTNSNGIVNDPNAIPLARYMYSTEIGQKASNQHAPAEGGTAIVGTLVPNGFGLYDMHGNVSEWCLDWYQNADLSSLAGAVNISTSDPTKTVDGSTCSYREAKGGCWYATANNLRVCYRNHSGWYGSVGPNKRDYRYGFRVVCPVGIE